MSVDSSSTNKDSPEDVSADTSAGTNGAAAVSAPDQDVEAVVAPAATFSDLGLCAEVLAAVQQMGFEKPTDVQSATVPLAREGKDLVIQSRTGSGKTAAFGMPLCSGGIDPSIKKTQALILAPTRELAQQVADEVTRLAAGQPFQVLSVYGGAAIGPQIESLSAGAAIVAATPGRLLDHLRRGTLDPERIGVLVLDECDEMLSMGFQEEINAIIERLPDDRQTLLFSATIPPEIERMIDRYLKDPLRVSLSEDFVGVREIDHVYYLVSGGARTDDLMRVLEYERPTGALIFCNTRDDTARVAEFLKQQGLAAEGISSSLTQRDRERVMGRMRAGELDVLVATDIAARGIDLANLSHVINYTFPESADVYIHRTGRTGRAGASGRAVSLVSPTEIGSFYYLKLIHRIYPEQRHLPSSGEMATRREGEHYDRLVQRFEGRAPAWQMEDLARRIWSSADGPRIFGWILEDLLNDASSRPSPPAGHHHDERDSSGSAERVPSWGRRERPQKRAAERPAHGAAATPDEGSFTTPDGDVEYFETVDADTMVSTATGERAENTARLYINVGRRHGVSDQELAEFVRAGSTVSDDAIMAIQLLDRHAYLSVRPDAVDDLISGLNGQVLVDRTVRVEPANPAAPGRSRRRAPRRPAT